MIYAYIRVSTDRQSVENQRYEVEIYAKNNNIKIDLFCEETMSGKIAIKHRKLGSRIKKLKKDDLLIVPELSRLGRSLLDVMETLNVQILQTDKKARWQGYTFFFKEGFCWSDISSEFIKCRLNN